MRRTVSGPSRRDATVWLLGLAMALVIGGGPAAVAAPGKGRPLVLLVGMGTCCAAEAWPEAEAAVKVELENLGLQVRLVQGRAAGERARRYELGTLADRAGAIGAIRIVRPREPGAGGVEIWIEDRLTKKMLFRQIPIAAGPGRSAASMTALRVAEALRASLIELSLKPRAAARRRLPPVVRKLTRVPGARPAAPGPWGLRFGGGGLWAPGGTGAGASLELGAGYYGLRHVSFLLEGAVTIYSDGVHEGALSSSFQVFQLRALAGWDWKRLRPLRVLIAGGAGLVVPWATGVGSLSADARTDQTAVAWLGGTARIGYDVGSRLTLWLGVEAGALVPEVRVLFGDVVVATFGRPLVSGAFTVEFRLP